MTLITEQPSRHRNLEKMTVEEITTAINSEDKTVPLLIERALPQINALISAVVSRLRKGGRLFYVGAGSGGRLSVLDALEMPTTYGVSKDMVNAILAGGLDRLIDAPEEKEDDIDAGWQMLQDKKVTGKDIVIGISASGTTPFVLSALQACVNNGIETGCIVSNPDSPIAKQAVYPVEIITGPEFITGSTRMKCGTAQKLILDMIGTTTMIRLGRVEDNRMVNVKLINNKIIDRAVKMLMEKAGIDNYETARAILMKQGSVRNALDHLSGGVKS